MILSAMTDAQIVTQVPFARAFTVGWEHLDSNGHMANTAYLNLAVTTRMMFFQANGFAMQEFEKQRFGPVVRRDEIEYFRELRLLDPVRVTLTLAGMSDDGAHFRLRNEFFRSDGKSAAVVTTTGGWLDLAARRLTVPPEAIVRAFQTLVRTEDFETLKSSVK
jgi:acyl-CoA thioester hydrolase